MAAEKANMIIKLCKLPDKSPSIKDIPPSPIPPHATPTHTHFQLSLS